MDGFSAEKRMKKPVKTSLKSKFGSDFKTKSEFEYEGGRADLVFLKGSKQYLARRARELGLAIPIENREYIRFFLQIHHRNEITEDYFLKLGQRNSNRKKKGLNWLVNKGFIERNGGRVRTAPELRRHVTSSYSVELKLSDWRTALEQAYRGKAFANKQYVAIDSAKADSALEHLDEFKKFNVGLITVRKGVGAEIQYEPDRIKPFSDVQKWKLNETSLQIYELN